MINPQNYIEEAKKLENSKSVYEYLMKDITFTRYEKIAELYNKAGNIYKINDEERAIKCFKKALYYYSQFTNINYELDKKNILLNIAELYSKIDHIKSIEHYEQIINYYTEKGDIYNIIKYYEIIADLYLKNNCTEESKQIYYKTLKIINSNSQERYSSNKKKICEKICEILIKSNNSADILEMGKIYFDLAEETIKINITTFNTKKYIFMGLLADCAADDIVKAKIDFEKYSNLDYTFTDSYEGKFIEKIFEAIESNNSEQLSAICADFDRIIKLNNNQVDLLCRIKKFLDNMFENDINTENDNLDLT